MSHGSLVVLNVSCMASQIVFVPVDLESTVWNKLKCIYLFLLDLAVVFNVHCDSFILLKFSEHETFSSEESMELIL